IYVDTRGTGKISDKKISGMIKKEVDMTPRGIIERLKLRRPVYQKTSAYGHFGSNDKDFTWEKLDLVPTFKKYL
ncbi:MAG: methionine adenosyltransferase, partial [Ignavibacteriae bacterium HGW-Ignavibacteriae-3]